MKGQDAVAETVTIQKLRLPKTGVIAFIAPSGAGKSTFAKKHFSPEMVISSDLCRVIIKHGIGQHLLEDSKHLSDESLSEGAFKMVHAWVEARLVHNLPVVVDATNGSPQSRQQLEEIAQKYHVRLIWLVLNVTEKVCQERNLLRPSPIPANVIKRQYSNFSRSLGWAKHQSNAYVIDPDDDFEIVWVEPSTKLELQATGYDIVGDVHGCLDELKLLLIKLGYTDVDTLPRSPDGRIPVFVGDIIDRGPKPYDALVYVRHLVEAGLAEYVMGNHDEKFLRWLLGRNVKIAHGLQGTIDSLPADLDKKELVSFLATRKPYLLVARNPLTVITHAAFRKQFLGKIDKGIEEFCRYGPTDGVLEDGKPNRLDWVAEYEGPPFVIYGHQVVGNEPKLTKWTAGIDTGCTFGGRLTAYRYPSGEIVQVDALAVYDQVEVPVEVGTILPKAEVMSELPFDLQDFLHSKLPLTGVLGQEVDIKIKPADLEQAVETLSTRTIDPAKLVWLAPTMSPGPVSQIDGLLEDPVTTATVLFDAAPGHALRAEVKHMGSRGTIMIDQSGVTSWSKNGYEIFPDGFREKIHVQLFARFKKLGWHRVIFDCEVMPWNLRGDGLIERAFWVPTIAGDLLRSAQINNAPDRLTKCVWLDKRLNLRRFEQVVNSFCWDVTQDDLSTVKIAPFAVLAYDNHFGREVFTTRGSQMLVIEKFWSGLPFYKALDFLKIPDKDHLPTLQGWFNDMVSLGAEGIVLKYEDEAVWGTVGFKFSQRMLKVRSKEYLRIIYGPQYDQPEIMADLKKSRSTRNKERLAYFEQLLADTALKGYLGGKPWEDWHRYIVFSVASEFFKVDPRL